MTSQLLTTHISSPRTDATKQLLPLHCDATSQLLPLQSDATYQLLPSRTDAVPMPVPSQLLPSRPGTETTRLLVRTKSRTKTECTTYRASAHDPFLGRRSEPILVTSCSDPFYDRSCSDPYSMSEDTEETTSDSGDQRDGGGRRGCGGRSGGMVGAKVRSRVRAGGGGRECVSSDCASPRLLPPIGVFWDIENCQIPRGKSALTVAQAIRDKFFAGYREAEFVVVCDVKKETPQVIQELNDAQLNLIHVGSTYKNAADEKLRQSMRRFADTHGSSAAIVLISGDVNFAPDLSDLRHRKKIYIILVHNDCVSETLILNADEHHSFQLLVKSLPHRTIPAKPTFQSYEVLVSNLPANREPNKVRGRLKRLAENCGGRVGYVVGLQTTLRFPSLEFALRAKKRLEGETVFGSAITVGYPLPVDNNPNSPMKSRFGGQRKKTEDTMHYQPAVVQYVTPFPWAPSNLSLVNMYGAMPIHPAIGPPPPPLPGCQDLVQQPTPGIQQPPHPPPPPQLMWGGGGDSNQNGGGGGNWREPIQNGGGSSWQHWNNNGGGGAPIGMQQRGRPILGSNCEKRGNSVWVSGNPHVDSYSVPAAANNGNTLDDSTVSSLAALNNSVEGGSGWSKQQQRAQSISPILPAVTLPANWQWQQQNSRGVTNQPAQWQPNKSQNGGTNRKCRTPSPYLSTSASTAGQHRPYSPYTQSHSDNEEHVMVLHVAVFVRSGGSLAAVVRVGSQQGAQYAISQLHRRKIGQKRIMISYARATSPHNPKVVRSQVASLLREVPGQQLPLFKFREMFESRYMNSISASDLYRMHDVCTITESVNGRTLSLNVEHRASPTPSLASLGGGSQVGNGDQPTAGILVCTLHAKSTPSQDDRGWAEQEAPGLPCLRVPLPEFSSRLLALLHSHNNMLPLASFCDCYEAQFGSILLDETGVPLEHLVTCVSGVQIKLSESCAKYLCSTPKNEMADTDKNEDMDSSMRGGGTVSPPLAHNLLIFGRELVDLLRNQPRCVLAFNKFIPSYHHHFHRQCRVADYGFTRLIDLFEALPHIVQVMGDGNKKTLTLSHRSQMRRFTCDLLRLLKLQPNKVVNVSELLSMFEKSLGRPFDAVDYGLCYLSDLLSQLVENTVVISHDAHNTYIAIPKREQTREEAERTKLFAQEVVELLSLSKQCTIKFEKFIPAYHHHFGYQCKVADFGFTKLIELFEAIPQVVKIEEEAGGERLVTLVPAVKVRVLAEQVADLVQAGGGLPLAGLAAAFQWQYGYSLRPADYQCADLRELVAKLHTAVKLKELDSGPTLVLVDHKQLSNVSLRVWRVLVEAANGKMSWADFDARYKLVYKQTCSLDMLTSQLQDTVNVIRDKEVLVQLTSLKLFALDVYRLLSASDGRLPVTSFEASYARCFGSTVQPAQYGCANLITLLQAIPQFVILRGKGPKRLIILNKELAVAGIALPCGLIRNPVRSSSACEIENKDRNQAWPAPPSEALLRGLRFPLDEKEEKPSQGDEEIDEGEPKTPKKEWKTTWPNFNRAQESGGKQGDKKTAVPAAAATPTTTTTLPTDVDLVQDSEGSCSGSDVNADQANTSTNSNANNTSASSVRRKLRLAAHFQTPLE
ncbi:hypothetical protein LSTR_LSTR005234 [Laodelphax striatellus]|uniref:HTH OST-type domain-containing protein n=1 Tax=Laodelphax striatellus TaxID=195883 RepID=A0A482XDC9_LAOST|nr:hypothetical protein LSTR_LSTR005234 [Laodelphax striatellus]